MIIGQKKKNRGTKRYEIHIQYMEWCDCEIVRAKQALLKNLIAIKEVKSSLLKFLIQYTVCIREFDPKKN